MFFSQRTRQRTKVIGISVASYVFVIGVLAAFSPNHSASYTETFFKWFFAVPVFLLTWFVLEWVGTTLLSLPFWQKMSSIARITLLVLCVVAVVVAVIYFRGVGS